MTVAPPRVLEIGGSVGAGHAAASRELAGRLNRAGARRDRARAALTLGWRTDTHRFMHAADVIVQDAEGPTFTEAYVEGLPPATCWSISGHGRADARVLRTAGLAP